MESPLDRYLRKLHGALTFTDCAGIHAKVRHLHRNRVVEVEQFRHVVMEQWKRFGQQRKHKNEYLNMKKNLSGKLGDDVKQILNDASEIIEMDDERKEISVTRAIRDEILRHSADLESDLTPNINLMEEVFESMKNPNFEKEKVLSLVHGNQIQHLALMCFVFLAILDTANRFIWPNLQSNSCEPFEAIPTNTSFQFLPKQKTLLRL